jgi:hypothetical protein
VFNWDGVMLSIGMGQDSGGRVSGYDWELDGGESQQNITIMQEY